MLRLSEKLQKDLITNIEILRIPFQGTAVQSIMEKNDLKRKASQSESTSYSLVMPSKGVGGDVCHVAPLTKEFLDLMDTPVPSGILAKEFAYHGLAPSFLKEMHQARELLDEIYTEIKM